MHCVLHCTATALHQDGVSRVEIDREEIDGEEVNNKERERESST